MGGLFALGSNPQGTWLSFHPDVKNLPGTCLSFRPQGEISQGLDYLIPVGIPAYRISCRRHGRQVSSA
ncbi:MAG: hypothetical protein CVT99_11915 [Bacteroidetes bacterium HGW-Bacteroidetes-16]|nr:MAG: hypothetical protein CVT99_11915 [Bacteroidetes bacterium HGW-Bacteroidetes-16]